MRPSRFRALVIALLALAPHALGAEDAAAGAPPPYPVESAVAESRSRSGTLRVKRLETERTGYAVREAQSRALPQLSLTASSTFMTNPPEGIRITQGAFGAAPQPGSQFPIFLPDQDYVLVDDAKPTYFKLTGSLDQLLWTWGKVKKAIEIAELDRKAADVAVRASERELARDVTKAYFGAAAARDSARLLGQAQELAREMVSDREKSLGAGAATMQDVLESRSQSAQIGSQRVRADQGLQTGLDALEFTTGSRPDPQSLQSPFRESLTGVDEGALVRAALASSTELETLNLKGLQARAAEEIRRASLLGLPDFSLNLTLSVEGQEVPLVSGNWTDTWDTNILLTIGGKVTLFDSLSSVWKLKQAQLQREQAEIGVSELSRGMGIQVRRLVDAVHTNAAMVEEKRASLAFARERARNATLSWENEMITRSEERGARLAAVSAELELLLTLVQTEMAIVDLEYLTGVSFPRG
jgi:outer membrane protein